MVKELKSKHGEGIGGKIEECSNPDDPTFDPATNENQTQRYIRELFQPGMVEKLNSWERNVLSELYGGERLTRKQHIMVSRIYYRVKRSGESLSQPDERRKDVSILGPDGKPAGGGRPGVQPPYFKCPADVDGKKCGHDEFAITPRVRAFVTIDPSTGSMDPCVKNHPVGAAFLCCSCGAIYTEEELVEDANGDGKAGPVSDVASPPRG